MRRSRKAKRPASSTPAHPRGCQCSGSGFVSMPDQTHANGHSYGKISVRCPGMQTSAPVLIAPPPRPAAAAPPPAAPTPPPRPPELFDHQKAAAGDREDLT